MDMNAECCWVYGLRAVDAADYFYVGSTKKTPEQRLKEHLSLVRKVRKIGVDRITVDRLEMATPEDRFDREYAWVRKLAAEGVRLTNIVADAGTYAALRHQEEITERVTSPDFWIAAFEMALEEGYRTPDPRNQRLYDAFRLVAVRYIGHLEQHHPGWLDRCLSGSFA